MDAPKVTTGVELAAADDGHGHCPLDSLLRMLMGPWTPYIVWLLETEGPLRFGAIKGRIPAISSKVLTERLRHLETAGLVTRTYKPTIPPSVTYALTQRGHELRQALQALDTTARRWAAEDAERKTVAAE